MVVGLKCKFLEMEFLYFFFFEVGDDSVFYDSDDINGEINDYIWEYKELVNYFIEWVLIYMDDSINENLRSFGN